eukprot:jgi/Mesvir1/10721/Mv13799-RA.1
MADDEGMEQTLLIVREVSIFKIPPRTSSGGYTSGDWRVSDKLFAGRLRVTSKGPLCQIYLEDTNTGELFATCPVQLGKRDLAVEQAKDSSRNFVIRLDDGKGHHAFVGLSFAERSEAFDFNVALSDFEKWQRREEEALRPAAAPDFGEGGNTAPKETKDLRLKEGEMIHINVKRPDGRGATGSEASKVPTGPIPLIPLAPPPSSSRRQPAGTVPAFHAPQPVAAQQQNRPAPSGTGLDDLLGGFSSAPAAPASNPFGGSNETGWANFN